MARINVDDWLDRKKEYKHLVRILKGNENEAMGMLVFFWRYAQDLWVKGESIPDKYITAFGWEPLVESGFAIKQNEGYYAIDSEKKFRWYKQKLDAAPIGGQARAETAQRDETGRFKSDIKDLNQPEPAGNEPSSFLVLSSSFLPIKASSLKRQEARTGVQATYPAEFEILWEAFGRVGKKSDALKAFSEGGLTVDQIVQLKTAIRNYLADCLRCERTQMYFGTFLRDDWREWLKPKKPLSVKSNLSFDQEEYDRGEKLVKEDYDRQRKELGYESA